MTFCVSKRTLRFCRLCGMLAKGDNRRALMRLECCKLVRRPAISDPPTSPRPAYTHALRGSLLGRETGDELSREVEAGKSEALLHTYALERRIFIFATVCTQTLLRTKRQTSALWWRV